ncbi:hypothetical protein, partial [Thermaurantimonas aggregans]|uniref:hypothetical protein n=1 Tax=Thermaurantimonas aggregans TaxID=2173829 RepID=UPI0023F3443B
MKRYVLLLFLSIYALTNAQNLIQNPSFEELNQPCMGVWECPFLRGPLEYSYSIYSAWVKNWYRLVDIRYHNVTSYNFNDVMSNGKYLPPGTSHLFLYNSNGVPIPQSRRGITHLALVVSFRHLATSASGICTRLPDKFMGFGLVGNRLKDTVKTGDYCGFFYARADSRNTFRFKSIGIFLKDDSLYQPFGPNVIYTNADLPSIGHVFLINDSASINQSSEWKKISFKTTIANGNYTMFYLGWLEPNINDNFSSVVDSTSALVMVRCGTNQIPLSFAATLYIDDVHFFRCSDTVFSVHLPPDTTLCEGESLTITPTVVDSLYALENDTRSYLW